MLLFRSEDDIAQWCATSGEPRGAILTVQQVWALSQWWYADRMSPDFHGRSLDDTLSIFRQLGLESPFWKP
jgi:hypothetical protein